MEIPTDQLLVDIERCREEMIELANTLTYSNKQVVGLSIKLDRLLNMYCIVAEKKWQ